MARTMQHTASTKVQATTSFQLGIEDVNLCSQPDDTVVVELNKKALTMPARSSSRCCDAKRLNNDVMHQCKAASVTT